MSLSTNLPNSPAGLIVSATEPIYSFLLSASKDSELSKDLRDLASDLSSQSTVHYKSLRSIWAGSNASTRPDLLHLFSGSDFVFTSPKPRQKSEELKVRLKKLEDLAERTAYEELVKDITPRKHVTKINLDLFLLTSTPTGLHVGLTMFTGYLVGYAAFRALFGHSPAMSAAGGILGLVCGMLVETLLFIIRTSSLDRKSSTPTSRQKKNQ